MRAIFYTKEFDNELVLEDNQVHHLKNVLRVSLGDEILILNGKGLSALGKIENINKKSILIKISDKKEVQPINSLELAIGIPKKDNFEDICRLAVELGVTKIYAVKTDYSQWSYEYSERLEKILISACVQSNNPWLPKIELILNVENLLKLNKTVIPMDLIKGKSPENIKLAETILLVGPEAGFSEQERCLFANLYSLNLKGPILRATTAVPTGIGYLRGCTR